MGDGGRSWSSAGAAVLVVTIDRPAGRSALDDQVAALVAAAMEGEQAFVARQAPRRPEPTLTT